MPAESAEDCRCVQGIAAAARCLHAQRAPLQNIVAPWQVTSTHTPLFVEVLDVYLWHYSASCESITPKYISSLLQLIEQQLAEQVRNVRDLFLYRSVFDCVQMFLVVVCTQEQGAMSEATLRTKAHYENTKAFLSAKCAADSRFAEVM